MPGMFVTAFVANAAAAAAPSLWNWSVFKNWLGETLGMSDDTLHTNIGLALLLLFAALLRRPFWTWRPWAALLVVETINEAYDMLQTGYRSNEANLVASLRDVAFTMAWPTIFLVAVPWYLRREARRRADADDQTPL